ncbi:FAD-dependent oxidoreductase [Streptomyces sp. E11-3]|uniref:NAD(P)/FAD-dependent oxidoreductase n=1 Tax=Streptomyces sp. E11-3 TaxID=3110112 RepID=UPI0039805A90
MTIQDPAATEVSEASETHGASHPASSVVIVGAGQAGSDTAAALRSAGYTGPVTLVGAEDALPYQRPPLSKSYLTGATAAADVTLRPRSFYEDQRIDLVLGDRAVELDCAHHRVLLASGREVGYGRLVLATGARPRRLPVPGAGLDGVLPLRDLADAEAVRSRLPRTKHLAVVGGGFIGLELAATARALGIEVTVIEAGSRLMARSVSHAMSQHLAAEHRRQGVRVLLDRTVTALHGDTDGNVRTADLEHGERVLADLVIVGVGVLPNSSLAADAGLAVGDGVLVDRRLRTSDPTVYAIGDCARFPSPHATRPLRLESVQNASEQARCVAAALCGDARPYEAVPWFWSEQYGLRLQIAGITQDHDHTVTTGDPAQNRFSVFCFQGGRLAGVESVNRPADHVMTRRLLASQLPGPNPAEVARPDFDLKAFQRARQAA